MGLERFKSPLVFLSVKPPPVSQISFGALSTDCGSSEEHQTRKEVHRAKFQYISLTLLSGFDAALFRSARMMRSTSLASLR